MQREEGSFCMKAAQGRQPQHSSWQTDTSTCPREHEGVCWRLTCRAQVRSREDSSGGASEKTAAMSSAALARVWKVPWASAPADSVPSASLPPTQRKANHCYNPLL